MATENQQSPSSKPSEHPKSPSSTQPQKLDKEWMNGVLQRAVERTEAQDREYRRQETAREQARQLEARQSRWRRANVPERHDCRKVIPSAAGPWANTLESVKALLGSGALIGIVGPVGTGKTKMAVEALRYACFTGDASVAYLKARDFFLALRECFRPQGPAERTVVKEYEMPGVLVIDEIGKTGGSAWEGEVLFHLIDKRYDAMKDTILVSNLVGDAFDDFVGVAIVDRMRECGGMILADWPSFREKARG